MLKWGNVIAFILTIFVNFLAGSTKLIGGVSTGGVSDSYQTLVTPPGYVFSIWSIIYILLGAFVIFQLMSNKKRKEYRNKIGWLFVSSCLLNIVWLFVWQYQMILLSVLVMLLLLINLIAIYLRVGIGINQEKLIEKLTFHLPFSVYLGWISIATIANISVSLVYLRWDGFGIDPQIWASLIVVVALLLAILVLFKRRDVAYGLVFVWALAGITIKQSGNQISMLTEISAILILAAIAVTLFFKYRKK
ncbi:MAG: tryptophan-rich sensory protein [Candidatus Aenigmarchaeota archaeon]|nr:tryptophan-rich sensory protein [Candidatus Aenigmarchaeota archaeon]